MGSGQHNYKPTLVYSQNDSIKKKLIFMVIRGMPSSTLLYNLAQNGTKYILREPPAEVTNKIDRIYFLEPSDWN